MRIGLAQIDCRLGDIEHNLGHMRTFVRRAREQTVDLLVFPELAVTGYCLGELSEESSLAPDDERLQPLLDESGPMALAFGLHEDGGLRTYNSAAYFESGRLVHVHHKLYLPTYGAFEERKHFSPGQAVRAFQAGCCRMSMMVCNDAWQPVVPFLAAQDGAEVLLVPTNSAESRFPGDIDTVTYWYDITRFYARMFQSFVVFVNRVGNDNGFEFWGRSHIVDPFGDIVVEAPAYREDLIAADIDVSQARRCRRRLPLIREARLALLCREFDRLAQTGGDL